MHLLPINFQILTLCSYWKPESLKTSIWKNNLYKLYSFVVVALAFTIAGMRLLNFFLEAIRGFDSMEDFALALLGIPNHICFNLKSLSIQSKRDKIYLLEKIFIKYEKMMNDKEAKKIRAGFDNYCRFLTFSVL